MNPITKNKHLIVIEGPTASGKTSLSVDLARVLGTSVLSADSRQFYKELSIGTAKPSIEEMIGIPHYFIDSHSIHDEFTAAQFEKEGLDLLEKLFAKKDTVILTGGSGMFIDALCLGLDDIPSSAHIKQQLQAELEDLGLNHLLNELAEKDKDYFEKVDKQNSRRILRALEVVRLTGIPFSMFRVKNTVKRSFEIHRFVINHERDKLYDRINRRVDIMMKQGLLDEAKNVYQWKNINALNTVGYKELFAYLDDKCTLEEAIELIKQNTRRYAKRQLTWFRRHEDSIWIDFGTNEEMISQIRQRIPVLFE